MKPIHINIHRKSSVSINNIPRFVARRAYVVIGTGSIARESRKDSFEASASASTENGPCSSREESLRHHQDDYWLKLHALYKKYRTEGLHDKVDDRHWSHECDFRQDPLQMKENLDATAANDNKKKHSTWQSKEININQWWTSLKAEY